MRVEFSNKRFQNLKTKPHDDVLQIEFSRYVSDVTAAPECPEGSLPAQGLLDRL